MKFRVITGRHIDARGKVYEKGQLVDSAADLTKLFEGRFEKLTEAKASSIKVTVGKTSVEDGTESN